MRGAVGEGLSHLVSGYFHEDFDAMGSDVGELLSAFVTYETEEVVRRAAADAAALLRRDLGEERLAAELDMAYDVTVEGMTYEGFLEAVTALSSR